MQGRGGGSSPSPLLCRRSGPSDDAERPVEGLSNFPSTMSESPGRVVKGVSLSHVLSGKSRGATRGRSGVLAGGGSLGVHERRARACSEALQAGEEHT